MLMVIDRGCDFERQYPILDPETGQPQDLTGWLVRGIARTTYRNPLIAYEWSIVAGNASVGAGKVTIRVPAADSTGWDWSKAVFKLHLIDPGGQEGEVDSGSILVPLNP